MADALAVRAAEEVRHSEDTAASVEEARVRLTARRDENSEVVVLVAAPEYRLAPWPGLAEKEEDDCWVQAADMPGR
jgi:hypothetical protein